MLVDELLTSDKPTRAGAVRHANPLQDRASQPALHRLQVRMTALAIGAFGLLGCSAGVSLLPTLPGATLATTATRATLQVSSAAPLDAADEAWQRLFETLDRALLLQRHYRSVFGSYASNATMLGLTLPQRVSDVFELTVNKESADRFTIAIRERCAACVQGAPLVTVDQNFSVQSSVKLPAPRRDYLVARAYRYLDALSEHSGVKPRLHRFREPGLFGEYFQYQRVRRVNGEMAWIARGTQHPVEGAVLASDETREVNSDDQGLPWLGPIVAEWSQPKEPRSGEQQSEQYDERTSTSRDLALRKDSREVLASSAERPLQELARSLSYFFENPEHPEHLKRGIASAELTPRDKRQPADRRERQSRVSRIQRPDGLVIESVDAADAQSPAPQD